MPSYQGMNNVSFTYPTKDKPTIMDVSLTVSQVSRVAVIGANGAGKSTAIKAGTEGRGDGWMDTLGRSGETIHHLDPSGINTSICSSINTSIMVHVLIDVFMDV